MTAPDVNRAGRRYAGRTEAGHDSSGLRSRRVSTFQQPSHIARASLTRDNPCRRARLDSSLRIAEPQYGGHPKSQHSPGAPRPQVCACSRFSLPASPERSSRKARSNLPSVPASSLRPRLLLARPHLPRGSAPAHEPCLLVAQDRPEHIQGPN